MKCVNLIIFNSRIWKRFACRGCFRNPKNVMLLLCFHHHFECVFQPSGHLIVFIMSRFFHHDPLEGSGVPFISMVLKIFLWLQHWHSICVTSKRQIKTNHIGDSSERNKAKVSYFLEIHTTVHTLNKFFREEIT